MVRIWGKVNRCATDASERLVLAQLRPRPRFAPEFSGRPEQPRLEMTQAMTSTA